jgi:hypothetical protein
LRDEERAVVRRADEDERAEVVRLAEDDEARLEDFEAATLRPDDVERFAAVRFLAEVPERSRTHAGARPPDQDEREEAFFLAGMGT